MLHVHRAERADGLVAALRDLLAAPLDDPFAAEVVAVPTRGMERWLTQRMALGLGATAGRGDGVCANVAFPSPRRLAGDAVAAAAGIEPDEDPWLPERSVWPLLEVVDEHLGEPWLHALTAHLGGPPDKADPVRRARRFSTVRHLAHLYDRYALHRPEMLAAWAADGAGHWQAELWRRLRARIGVADPVERLGAACERLRADAAVADLPRRVSLFGLTRMPAGHLHVVRALAAQRDVHLFLLHPSPALWRRIAELDPAVVRREEDPTRTLPRSRLLASWGTDAREMQLVVGGDHAGHHHPVEHRDDTLLARIQADVRADRAPTPAPLDPGDQSVQIHACHGRARQVEVLRDAILHLLEDDEKLEPRDVIVMCPDIETFAPLIQATFGAGEIASEEDGADGLDDEVRPPDLRVRLADRSLRQTNPVLGVVAQLIDLADQRLTASQVLDVADREPVRRRFGLDDAALAQVEDWVAESGIRWGLDAEHRRPFRLEKLDAGTWRKGLDRVLVGVTMTEDHRRLFEGVLPLDDVDSGAIDLAGRFAELIDRLQARLEALARAKTIDGWAEALAAAADELTATTPGDAWQRAQLQRILDDVVQEARTYAQPGHDPAARTFGAELGLAEVRALLAERLQGRPTRANFRTGHLTICTLMPMRSVPHRVVCLLGLDDGVFPRKAPRDGDDLMLADPHVGDRDQRTEDRQLLLDALLAARDRLVITYTGNDERTNTPRPPAVPVGELLDVVDASVIGDAAREHVVVRHPLQPFDPRNYQAGELAGDDAWSFDRVTLDGARALTEERGERPPFLAAPLPPVASSLVEVEDLVRFAERPVRTFLRRRLGVSVADYSDEVEDALPVELDGLERWKVGQRMLDARLAGADPVAAYRAEIARGNLPPNRLAVPLVKELVDQVDAIFTHASAVLEDPGVQPGSLDVRVTLPDGRALGGTVPNVCGDVLRTVTYSRVSARHRLVSWVRLLALTAAHPDRPFEAVTIGRVRDGGRSAASATVARIAPLGDDAQERRATALHELGVLVDLYDRGMREPPPLFCLTSAAYARAAREERDAVAAGRAEWLSEWNCDREDREPDHQLVLGGVADFDDLLAGAARDDERGPGWDTSEPSRFGRHARRLWDGLLSHEHVEDR